MASIERRGYIHRNIVLIVPHSASEKETLEGAVRAAFRIESLPGRPENPSDQVIYRELADKLRSEIGAAIIHSRVDEFNLPLPGDEYSSKMIARVIGPIHRLALVMTPSETGPGFERRLVGESFVRRVK